jgi:translation initiation factor 1 (eIF-1/SUI1)
VIIIDDFAASISKHSLQLLARKLRVACGCAGTIHQRTIHIQGSRLDKVPDVLEQEGFCVAAG